MAKSRSSARVRSRALRVARAPASGPTSERVARSHAAWQAAARASSERLPLRKARFTTTSDLEVPQLALPEDPSDAYLDRLGYPGAYPFTRGVQATGYQGRLWTMRQFAGFGTAEQTNRRFRYLLAQGQTGLSTAFDFPTLMGYDSDSPVGMCGVAVDSLRDMEILFDGIALDEITTSMTINGPALVLLAFYVALADNRGIPRSRIGGTIQNDCLKEFIAQHAWVVGPRPAMRIVTDMIEFCTAEMPRWNSVSISGYHIREAGATATQELAFTLADGLAYVQSAVARGIDVDAFAPRLSFFFDVHSDFFEEIAKFRAARRMWARFMRERFGAKRPESMMLRTHAQTAGVTLTAQQPYNNVVRVALQALSAVLGGTQSLHTNSLDETYALPTEEAVRIALRTQQIIAEESGVANTIDPLAGSYFVEGLTDRLESEALQLIEKVDALGGMVSAVERGYPQREIAASAYRFQRQLETGERSIVGVNAYASPEPDRIPTLRVDESAERTQRERLAELRRSRDESEVSAALAAVRSAAGGTENLVPHVIRAAKAYCTEQEVCDVLREVMGSHSDRPEF
jgi:methylmalonyl-CoA mutase N-terminal domain/subunit